MFKRYYKKNLKSPFHQIVPNLHYKQWMMQLNMPMTKELK